MGANTRAAIQVVVHFVCGDVDAAANEDFLLAAVDLYTALFVLNAQVARDNQPSSFRSFAVASGFFR